MAARELVYVGDIPFADDSRVAYRWNDPKQSNTWTGVRAARRMCFVIGHGLWWHLANNKSHSSATQHSMYSTLMELIFLSYRFRLIVFRFHCDFRGHWPAIFFCSESECIRVWTVARWSLALRDFINLLLFNSLSPMSWPCFESNDTLRVFADWLAHVYAVCMMDVGRPSRVVGSKARTDSRKKTRNNTTVCTPRVRSIFAPRFVRQNLWAAVYTDVFATTTEPARYRGCHTMCETIKHVSRSTRR